MALQLGRSRVVDGQVAWITMFFMALFHAGAIVALFFFGWKPLMLAIFLWWVSGSLGIGMCYHRLLTHRGYKTPKWVEYIMTVCATMALETESVSVSARTRHAIEWPTSESLTVYSSPVAPSNSRPSRSHWRVYV